MEIIYEHLAHILRYNFENGTLWGLKCCITCICFISWKNFVSLNLPTLMFIKLDKNRKEGHTMEWMLIKLLWDFDLKQYNTKLSLSIHIFTPYFSLIFLIWIEDPEHVLKKIRLKTFLSPLEKTCFSAADFSDFLRMILWKESIIE